MPGPRNSAAPPGKSVGVGIGGLGILERLAVLGRGAGAVAVGHALSDLIVPLLFGPTVQKTDDDHSHVVASNATRLTVGSQAIVHHVLTDAVEVLLGGNTATNELNDGLRGLAIPDTCIDISTH